MPVNRKAFYTDSRENCLVVDDNNGVTLKSGGNNVIVSEDQTSIKEPFLETLSPKQVMTRGSGLLGLIPTMPPLIPSIPFAQMLPTLAIVGAAAATLASANVAKSSK
jgi:hypothetical protein